MSAKPPPPRDFRRIALRVYHGILLAAGVVVWGVQIARVGIADFEAQGPGVALTAIAGGVLLALRMGASTRSLSLFTIVYTTLASMVTVVGYGVASPLASSVASMPLVAALFGSRRSVVVVLVVLTGTVILTAAGLLGPPFLEHPLPDLEVLIPIATVCMLLNVAVFTWAVVHLGEVRSIALAERATALDEALHEISELQGQLVASSRMAALGQMAASVAHELNNPLTSLIMGADLVQENLAEEPLDVADLRENIETILTGAERCQGVVEGLLDFSRRGSEAHRPIAVQSFLGPALELARHPLALARHTLVVDVQPDLIVRGDRGQLSQVVLNLLLNASQAMDEPGEVKVCGAALGDRVRVTVSDAGPGVPDAIREQIFERYFTTKAEGLGTGLGLSICHGIVRQHGGTLEVDNCGGPHGTGACFHVLLPRAPGAET